MSETTNGLENDGIRTVLMVRLLLILKLWRIYQFLKSAFPHFGAEALSCRGNQTTRRHLLSCRRVLNSGSRTGTGTRSNSRLAPGYNSSLEERLEAERNIKH